ncbi:MAG: hypothetical protein ACT4P4_11875 [Betaproteobacteria bacterium]
MSRLCVDTGFFIALFGKDDKKSRRESAREYLKRFDNRVNKMILAWPVVYEVFRSQITRASEGTMVRELDAHELTRGANYRGLSLVDRVVRMIIGDPRSHVDALITADPKDFADICRRRQVEVHICA